MFFAMYKRGNKLILGETFFDGTTRQFGLAENEKKSLAKCKTDKMASSRHS